MWKWTLVAILSSWCAPSYGQIIGASVVEEYVSRRPGDGVAKGLIDTGVSLNDTSWSNIVISSHSIPISFSKIEFGDKTSIGAELGLGYSYTFILGKARRDVGGTLDVRPHMVFGPTAQVGLTQGTDELEAGFKLGGFLGFSGIAVVGGYDFVGEAAFIGLATQIDLFSIFEDQAMIWNVW